MPDLSNPFQSPETDAKIVKPLVSQGILTDTMIKYLRDTSPWLHFMGIMGFIGSGFMAFAGLLFIIFVPFGLNLFDDSSGFFSDFISPFTLMMGNALYLIGAGVLMFFPALFTYRFGAKIRSFILSNSEDELELALKNNKSLWKFNGILMIIILAFLPVMIIIGVIVAVAAIAIF